ncbi:hypothetical protein GSI_13869 [Ganoderma sinense ZZ0214-1]|uniref:DUF6533 domain-containing protein n=1 Tax=Ganoderma sinense ZZ0214-1 TaxID=1077348 RepID=A0A2G8RRI5_9APHY|nr:hypothetical protein GSI_13869 [Ganoderma sinense ZZ0214-1]
MVDPLQVDWVLSFRENNYLSVAAFTVLYYDYALTFTDEVNYFWKSASLSVFSTLFVLNRYLGLIGTIPIIVEYFADIPETAAMIPKSHPENASGTTPDRDPPNQCDLSLTNAQAIRFSIGWGAMLWFDTTVFLLTLVRTLRTHNRLSGGILEVLLRDGTIYFGRVHYHRERILLILIRGDDSIMVVLNVSNIVTFLAIPVGSKKGMETTLVNG